MSLLGGHNEREPHWCHGVESLSPAASSTDGARFTTDGVRFTTDGVEQAPWAGTLDDETPIWSRLKKYVVFQFQRRRMRYRLRNTRLSFALTLLALWHTLGLWLASCIFLTLAANLLLAWYIEWFRNLQDTEQHTFVDFPYVAFAAIFLRSWTAVCVTAELIRFCFMLTVDCWRLDAFRAYRRAVCAELQLDTELSRGIADWRDSFLMAKRRWLDTVWQCIIYISFDVVPFVRGLSGYLRGKTFYSAGIDVRVAASSAACVHVMIFFLSWIILDIHLKVVAFFKALRGEGSEQPPRQYEGEKLDEFQWAGSFGDRHLQNLESARNLSFCDDGSHLVFNVPPHWDTSVQNIHLPQEEDLVRCMSFENNNFSSSSGSLSQTCPASGTSQMERPEAPPQQARTRELSNGEVAEDSSGAQQKLTPPGGSTPTSMVIETMNSANSLRSPRPPGVAERRDSRDSQRGSYCRHEKETADKLNICVSLCGVVHGIMGELCLHLCWILMILVGVRFANWGLVLSGVMVGAMISIRYGHVRFGQNHEPEWRCCLSWRGGSWRLWSLQAWGEKHCSLTREHYLNANITFGIVVLLQAILFAELSRFIGMMLCLFMLLCLVLRQSLMSYERPWGWLIGCLEGFCIAIVTISLNLRTGWGWFCVVVACLRQFGLARHNADSFQVMRFTTLFLNVVLVLVVSIVTLTAVDDSGTSKWSALCHPGSTPGCTYYEVPYKEPDNMQGLVCQGRFNLGGKASNKTLTLSDFALFSAIAYESNASMNVALAHFFNGWRVDGYHFANTGHRDMDWTTFFEFSDPDNTTTVFSVRGTDSKLDILNDINIWTPATIIQMFSFFGPDIASGSTSHCVTMLSTTMYGGFQKRYFEVLLDRVYAAVKASPERRFYITGHSLGGGLAKLVAARVGIQAITFMAPGLSTTNFVVFGEDSSDMYRQTSFTVQPDNDVVSRVDAQVGIVVQTECKSNPAYCHQMYPLLCELYRRCGSGRSETLMLPTTDVNGNQHCVVPAA